MNEKNKGVKIITAMQEEFLHGGKRRVVMKHF